MDIEGDSGADDDWVEELIALGAEPESDESDNAGVGVGQPRVRESVGQRKRRKVKEALFASELFN